MLADVRRAVVRVEETAEEFLFTFPRSPELLVELDEFVRFEAACCSFITMELFSLGDDVRLRMSAPQGAKPFIQQEFINVHVASDASEPSSAGGCKT